MYVVPANSVIKPSGGGGGKGSTQSSPNAAGPADYISYNYNDSGFKDVGHVVISADGFEGGGNLGDLFFDSGSIAYHSYEGPSQASGVLVINIHPWMALGSFSSGPADSPEAADRFDKPSDSMYSEKKTMGAAAQTAAQGHAASAQQQKGAYSKTLKSVAQSYAQTKLYQNKYFDRQGSITMDFNPQWVPGTGGTLFMRESGMYISFFVTSVTHKIDIVAPNSGQAITIVNFSCGRLGTSPTGADKDEFLGYNGGSEVGVQKSFLGDIS
jgi:hypothetical protein